MDRDHIINHTRRDFFRIVAGGAALLAAASPSEALAQTTGGMPLKIGTIGAGHIGSTLGTLWLKAGHPVMFSSRHPEELKSLVDGLGANAHAGTPAEAIAFADVVLLAVPYGAMPQIAHDFASQLAAKALVLDATNPIVQRDGEVAAQAREKGAGAAAAELLPGVHLVRTFNAIGSAKLPEEGTRPASQRIGMPMAGDDLNALALASILVREAGLEPVVIGPLAMGKYLLPGTPLAGEHTPEEIRQILTTLK
jgi:predicted dinucleotide-binding enzyme